MSQNIRSTQVQIMDLGSVFSSDEYIIKIIGEVGLPPLTITNKAIYKILFGKGVVEETKEIYDTYNQVTKEFDFSIGNPIFDNTLGLVINRKEKELKILTYSIMHELSSISKISNYLNNQWQNICESVNQNIKEYEYNVRILPNIPFLKESVDGFFVEYKNIVSYILTIFKIYYQHKTIEADNPYCSECLKEIKNKTFFSVNKDLLYNIFQKLDSHCAKMRAMRNALNHPENYKENLFLLYDIHWGNNKILCPPIMEYTSKLGNNTFQGQENVLEYFNSEYSFLLEIFGKFINTLVIDLDASS